MKLRVIQTTAVTTLLALKEVGDLQPLFIITRFISISLVNTMIQVVVAGIGDLQPGVQALMLYGMTAMRPLVKMRLLILMIPTQMDLQWEVLKIRLW